MANASSLAGDHALRTPMSWTSNSVTAGFTTGTPFRDLSENVATHNVMDEEGVTDSLLEHYRTLYQLRISHPFVASGSLTLRSSAGDPALLFTREESGSVAVVAINFSASSRQVAANAGLANTTFDAAFGASGQLDSDSGSVLTFDVPARSAVVYVYTPM